MDFVVAAYLKNKFHQSSFLKILLEYFRIETYLKEKLDCLKDIFKGR